MSGEVVFGLITLGIITVIFFVGLNFYRRFKNLKRLRSIARNNDIELKELSLDKYRIILFFGALLIWLKKKRSALRSFSDQEVYNLFLFFYREFLRFQFLGDNSYSKPSVKEIETLVKKILHSYQIETVKFDSKYLGNFDKESDYICQVLILYLYYTSSISDEEDIQNLKKYHLFPESVSLEELDMEKYHYLLAIFEHLLDEVKDQVSAFIFLAAFLGFYLARVSLIERNIFSTENEEFYEIFLKLLKTGSILRLEGNSQDEKFLKDLIQEYFGIVLDVEDLQLLVLFRYLTLRFEISTPVLQEIPEFYLNDMQRTKELLGQFLESNFNLALLKQLLVYKDIGSLETIEDVNKALSKLQEFYSDVLIFKLIQVYKSKKECRDYISKVLDFWEELLETLSFKLRKILLREGEFLLFKPLEKVSTGEEFEKFCANFFSLLGFEVELTPKVGDQGADLILTDQDMNERIVVQCKHYSSAVGNKAVQEALSAKEFYKADKAIVVTNSTFTKSAKELAVRAGVELIDGRKLKEWLSELDMKGEREVYDEGY